MLRASSRAWDWEERRQAHQQKPWKSGPIGKVTFRDLPAMSDNNNCHHQCYLLRATLFIYMTHIISLDPPHSPMKERL